MSSRIGLSLVAFCFLMGCGGAASTSAPVSSTTGPASPTSGPVTFTKKPRAVGLVVVTHDRNETAVETDVTTDGVRAEHSSSESVETIERHAVVLAIGADGAVTRIRVSYDAHHTDEKGKARVVSPVESKTYVLEASGNKSPPSVTDVAGHPVPTAEASVAAGDFKHLGQLDPIWRGLPEHPIAPGETMKKMETWALEQDAPDGLEEVHARFGGERELPAGRAGVFDLEYIGHIGGDEATTLRGQLTLLLSNGWEALSDASAPLELKRTQSNEGKETTVVIHGTMHIHRETSYGGQ